MIRTNILAAVLATDTKRNVKGKTIGFHGKNFFKTNTFCHAQTSAKKK